MLVLVHARSTSPIAGAAGAALLFDPSRLARCTFPSHVLTQHLSDIAKLAIAASCALDGGKDWTYSTSADTLLAE